MHHPVSPLIRVDELNARLRDGEAVVIADCRFQLADPEAGPKAWRAGHLPGSYHLHLDHDLSGPRTNQGGRHPLPTAEAFTATMRGIGLRHDMLLVACDDGSHAGAARLWWLARYFGHRNTRVLDGGIAAWTRAGYPLDEAAPASGYGDFSARPDDSMRIAFAGVQARRADLKLVDARDPRRYAGLEEPVDPRGGHIPGAWNLPWQGAMDAAGCMLDAAAQRQRWSLLAEDTRQPVMYCGSGVTACVNLLALEIAGIHGALLYAGSWSDWCQQDGPVATGSQP